MTAETDLLPLPEIERYEVVGDIAYPISSDPDGDYVAHDDHAAAMHAYARANVLHHTAAQAAEIESLRAEVSEWKRVAAAQAELHDEAEASAERLAEALRECIDNREGLAYESEILDRARALLRDQEEGHE